MLINLFIIVWCWLKLSKDKWYKGINLWITITFTTLTLIGWISVVVTVYQIIVPPPTPIGCPV